MRIKILFAIGFYLFFQAGCVGLNSSYNNVWKVSGTDLSIAVEKHQPSLTQKIVERKLLFRENYSDKSTFKLAPTDKTYIRLNIYQISERSFLIRDTFETYELNTETKILRKISPPTDTANGKFIGAFDDNENGNWRYIPASERGEIALGTEK